MDDIVIRILQQSKAVGISQKNLAEKIGIRPQAITEWKIGTTTSYTKYLPQIADVLNVSIDYLMTGEKETTIVSDDALTSDQRKAIEKIKNMPPEELARKMAALEAVLNM